MLSRDVEELLFAHATILTESRVGPNGYDGSTMFTVDLSALRAHVRHPDPASFGVSLLALAGGSVRVRVRAMRFACAEASRRVPEETFATFSTETRMRLERDSLLIDVDVSAAFARSERERAT